MVEIDNVLVERFADTGDTEAYDAIVQRYSKMVYAVCYRILHDPARADDVCQETFIHLLQNPDRIKGPLFCWLHTTATWKSIDVLRQEIARSKREAKFAAEKEDGKPSVWEELSPFIDQALADLPEEERMLLVCHFLEGINQEALADRMGTSQATVSRKVKAGLNHLRKNLQKHGRKVGALALVSFLGDIQAQGASLQTVGELGKLVGQTAGTGWKLRPILTRVGKIVAAALLLILLLFFLSHSFGALPSRDRMRSVHYITQIKNTDPGAPFCTSKMALECWFYYPEGADGPLIARTQKWDPLLTVKTCNWLQNEHANYSFSFTAQTLSIVNWRGYRGDLRVRRLPTDRPELIAFLDTLEEKIPYVCEFRDNKTGFLVKEINNRFFNTPNFVTNYEYDTAKPDFFKYFWPPKTKVEDLRDAVHKQGWSYVRIEGRIGDEKVHGTGRIPLVYGELNKNSPWLKLSLDHGRWILDCRDGAYYRNSSGTVFRCSSGHFFRGLARPWMGLHTIDIVRRDAALAKIPFETKALESDPNKVEVTLRIKDRYILTTITYLIDLDKDWIDRISFSHDLGPGRKREGTFQFTYLDKTAQPTADFSEPALNITNSQDLRPTPESFWLLDLAKNTMPEK